MTTLNKLWEEFQKQNSDTTDEIDLKLNFINYIVKTNFGGNTNTLLGFIGGDDFLDKDVFAYMNVVRYSFDKSLALITEFSFQTRGLTLSEDKAHILDMIAELCDVVDLKLGYVAYKKNDKFYDTFKNLGFIETGLKTDFGCVILVRKPVKP